MVEEQRKRVEKAFNDLTSEIDLSHMRKMQAAMHRCAAKCCEDRTSSTEGVQRCIESCAAPLSGAEKFLTNEFNALQNRLQRCIMDCNDDIRDKMGPNPSQSDVQRYTSEFESCAIKCVDNIEKLLPSTRKKIKTALDETMSQQKQLNM